jgi:hypothetical protein
MKASAWVGTGRRRLQPAFQIADKNRHAFGRVTTTFGRESPTFGPRLPFFDSGRLVHGNECREPISLMALYFIPQK